MSGASGDRVVRLTGGGDIDVDGNVVAGDSNVIRDADQPSLPDDVDPEALAAELRAMVARVVLDVERSHVAERASDLLAALRLVEENETTRAVARLRTLGAWVVGLATDAGANLIAQLLGGVIRG